MDASLFQTLSGGIKFDRKKFKEDVEAFKPSKTKGAGEENEDDRDVLDFFGDKRKRSRKDDGANKRRKLGDKAETRSQTGNQEEDSDREKSDGEEEEEEAGVQLDADGKATASSVRNFRKKHRIKVKGNDVPAPARSFSAFVSEHGMEPFLESNVSSQFRYAKPTPVQMQAIPALLAGRSALVCAPTGSGKTAAFVLPLLSLLKRPRRKDGVRGLILSPTRELAVQTFDQLELFSAGRNFKSFLLSSSASSIPTSGKNCDIIVSTPLRLLRLVEEGQISLANVEYFVMDECDKLFELGFLKQVDKLIAACTKEKLQIALFSATILPQIEDLANSILPDPVQVVIGERNAATETIEQKLIFCGREAGKVLAVRQLIQEGIRPPVLIFVQSKERAVELFHELLYDGINVDCITADRTQHQRDNSVRGFRTGKTWVLIASDLIARGMDFKGVNVVINFDVPPSVVQYIHRIGRTGRAGRSGKAVTLYTEDDVEMLRSIGMVMKKSGMSVPAWIHSLPKLSSKRKKELLYRPKKRPAVGSVAAEKAMTVKLDKLSRKAKRAKRERKDVDEALKDCD